MSFSISRILTPACVLAAAMQVTPAVARDQLQVVGSSTVYPFSAIVAERFGNRGKFKTPVIESTGTGGGMKLFCQGVGANTPDVSNASRAMKSSEWDTCQKNGVKDIIEVAFGNDGIAFANDRKGPRLNLTRKQLWMALAEKGPKPQKWSEIDASLPDAKITVLVPPPTSGTRDAWNSLVMKKGCPDSVKKVDKKACKILREDGAAVEAGENDALIVQKLEADPSAFGIFGFSYLDNNRDRIQAATIEGVEINIDSIQDYSYPISRPLFFYVKKAHIGIVPGLQEFLAEFTAEDAIGDDGYLMDAGLVPLSEVKRVSLQKEAGGLTVMSK
ncbi:MAG: substrate-binding domain-containing protein [Gammaproteobacteria bacterium]|nr:substrate-binding domain-containing protein [Gammaproteobacteria bacterium]